MSNANLLNTVKISSPGRNMFNLSHSVQQTQNAGELCPCLVMEVVPGDKFKIGCHSLTRLQPLVTPFFGRARVYFHYFFVPTRLTWQKWEMYITGNQGNAPSLPAHPYINWGVDAPAIRLGDYFGLPDPTGFDNPVKIDATVFAAYQLIWNNYYRDQNLVPEFMEPQNYPLVDGDNTGNPSIFDLQRRAWKHDYFTSCLPWEQKGPQVEIPIVANFEDVSVLINNITGANLTNSLPPNPLQVAGHATGDVPADTLYAATSGLDLNSTSINDLRVAYRLQEWYEKQARGGSRYDENILVFFGVKTEDFRLQRPEYITGTVSDIAVSEVLQTSETTNESPQGNMSGHGYAVTSGKYGSYYAKEHGWIICLCSIMPDAIYSQGIDRMWSKINNPQEKFWPQFEHLGEQAILNQEIFAQGTVEDQETFGYLPRYAEYRVLKNRLAGQFKTSLAHWVWQRRFADLPQLNQAFIECNPDYDVFAVTDPNEDHFLLDIVHEIKALRPMGKYGTPTF